MAIPFEQIVKQDLRLGYGTQSVSMPGGGSATGDKIGLHTFGGRFWYSALDFPGVLCDGNNDDTAGLRVAYAQAKADHANLWCPPHPDYPAGYYRLTGTLTWDGPVMVRGAGNSSGGLAVTSLGGTRFKKAGNFVGIKILSGGEDVEYSDFLLDSLGGSDASTGLYIDLGIGGAGTSFRNLGILRQGSHGIEFVNGANNLFSNVFCSLCGGDGLRLAATGSSYANANTFVQMDLRQNAGYGLNIAGGGTGTYGNQFFGMVCQNNTSYGVRSNSNTPNAITAYVEGNLGGDVLLDTSSVRQFVTLLNSSFANPAVVDNGTNNVVFDFSTGRFWMPSLTVSIPGTNVAGRDLSIFAGKAGAGGVGKNGGILGLAGGDAVGTAGAANGGALNIDGGQAINGGTTGAIQLAGAVDGPVRIGGTAAPGVSVALDLQSTTRVLVLNRLTTTQRDVLTPINGMIIYNTTVARVQIYENSGWTNIT